MKAICNFFSRLSLLILLFAAVQAQPVTGVWRGKITRGNGLLKQSYKLELKLVKNGDSLTGTSYYYASANNYYRYSVKGYFGSTDNSINWWDDQLIESRLPNVKIGNANNQPLMTTADYNCPGSGIMLLNGNSHVAEGGKEFDLQLQKYENPDFKDEWDPIIEDYFVGGADPHLIDSVGKIAFLKPAAEPVIAYTPAPEPAKKTTVYAPPKKETQPAAVQQEIPVKTPAFATKKDPAANPKPILQTQPTPTPQPAIAKAPPTIEEKFTQRKTTFTTTIPVSGDSIEFRFYDNAEVDGDSISIFLNSKLLYTHIRLTDKAYSIKIAVSDLQAENELVMVAENLGSIPPNTAYMEAWSGAQRYAARLESTEESSAMIKLKKE